MKNFCMKTAGLIWRKRRRIIIRNKEAVFQIRDFVRIWKKIPKSFSEDERLKCRFYQKNESSFLTENFITAFRGGFFVPGFKAAAIGQVLSAAAFL